MMETAKDFEYVRIALCNGIDQEILNLKHFMEGIDESKFNEDPEYIAGICEKIFYTSEGLKKLADVLSFIDCWEENGDVPQLSQNLRFDTDIPKEEQGQSTLKEWQKEIMFSEGHSW